MTSYLVDTSVLARTGQREVELAIDDAVRERRIACVSAVAYEIGLTARSPEEFVLLQDLLAHYPLVRILQVTFDRTLEVQADLVTRRQHRGISLVDLLVAAAAEASGLTVLHYDRDFDRIAEVTSQATEWVVPAGSVP